VPGDLYRTVRSRRGSPVCDGGVFLRETMIGDRLLTRSAAGAIITVPTLQPTLQKLPLRTYSEVYDGRDDGLLLSDRQHPQSC
jgi:hypothetical protein